VCFKKANKDRQLPTKIKIIMKNKSHSNDVFIGKGDLNGKGVYANRAFKKGEMITGGATKDDVS
jgi:hypothetical protein